MKKSSLEGCFLSVYQSENERKSVEGRKEQMLLV